MTMFIAKFKESFMLSKMKIGKVSNNKILLISIVTILLNSCSSYGMVHAIGKLQKGAYRFVYGQTGKANSIIAFQSKTIHAFKEVIARKNQIPVKEIQIIYNKKELKDNAVLGKKTRIMQVIVPLKFKDHLKWFPRHENLEGTIRSTKKITRKIS